jgi:hypothetical protein
MARFLNAAEKALKKAKRPLAFRELTEIALQNGWLETKGQTPWHTMKSKLSTDILEKKEQSKFIRVGKGKFALRIWLGDKINMTPIPIPEVLTESEKEYTAHRFKKSPMQEEILVFPASSLHKYIPGPGLHFKTQSELDGLLNECHPMLRISAEKDFSVIQLVSVFIVKFDKEYLTYKRTKRLPEERLHSEHSMIFGGHLTASDFQLSLDFNRTESISDIFLRELHEELV